MKNAPIRFLRNFNTICKTLPTFGECSKKRYCSIIIYFCQVFEKLIFKTVHSS